MPLETYFNLPLEKQEKILQSAVYEFASKGYQNCLISSIAKKAGVAKGSIYQYFLNKKELFIYIFDLAIEKKIAFVNQIIVNNRSDYTFFELLEKILLSSFKYAEEHPHFYQIYNNLLQSKNKVLKEEIMSKINSTGQDYYQQMLEEAIMGDDIRTDISMGLATFVVYNFLNLFSDYLIGIKGQFTRDEIGGEIKKFISVLKYGLKERGENIYD